MSALPLIVLAHLTLSCPAASEVPFDRVKATASVESGLQEFAVHENWPPHSPGRSYLPATKAEAVALVVALHARGHSLDAGVMQVNDANWSRLGLTTATVFDRRANVCAGMAVLAEAYAIERRVSCRYNTGSPDCRNGYPERIERAAAQLRQDDSPPALLPVPTPPDPSEPPAWDAWAHDAWERDKAAIPAAPAAAEDAPIQTAPADPAPPAPQVQPTPGPDAGERAASPGEDQDGDPVQAAVPDTAPITAREVAPSTMEKQP